jgi:hypothetical protein
MKTRLCLIPLLAAGCAPVMKTLKFDSDPQGARVFLGRGINEGSAKSESYLGTTPCDWTVEVNRDGTFKMPGIPFYSSFVAPVYVFIGRLDGVEIRQKVHGGATFQPADIVPEGIFFDFKHPTNAPAK